MITTLDFGTALGPHAMRDGERTARLCTLCTRANRPPAVSDLRKCVTTIYWGSSGRRFKSCQPDTVLSRDIVDRCRETWFTAIACFQVSFRI
jgi:hypothetical protein